MYVSECLVTNVCACARGCVLLSAPVCDCVTCHCDNELSKVHAIMTMYSHLTRVHYFV